MRCVRAQVGLALEPGAQPHVLVTGSAVEGTLKLSDVRMTGQLPEAHTPSGQGTAHMGVCKTFNTELRGRLTAMAAHSSAPLIAAGSSHQVGLPLAPLRLRPAGPAPCHAVAALQVVAAGACLRAPEEQGRQGAMQERLLAQLCLLQPAL